MQVCSDTPLTYSIACTMLTSKQTNLSDCTCYLQLFGLCVTHATLFRALECAAVDIAGAEYTHTLCYCSLAIVQQLMYDIYVIFCYITTGLLPATSTINSQVGTVTGGWRTDVKADGTTPIPTEVKVTHTFITLSSTHVVHSAVVSASMLFTCCNM
jgi:hypothetical protein